MTLIRQPDEVLEHDRLSDHGRVVPLIRGVQVEREWPALAKRLVPIILQRIEARIRQCREDGGEWVVGLPRLGALP